MQIRCISIDWAGANERGYKEQFRQKFAVQATLRMAVMNKVEEEVASWKLNQLIANKPQREGVECFITNRTLPLTG